jgi:uncharacterized membrane protein YidH (DUF202 family)
MSSRDPGLQPERTDLAWSRTLLNIVVNGGLVLRTGSANHNTALMLAGAVLVATGGALVVVARLRASQLQIHPKPVRARMIQVASVAAGITCLAGTWAILG